MKASEIMLDETLPHGTKEGHEAGCKGSHCPGVEKLGMTCKQASIRYASDYSYRRRIDNGLSPEAIWAEDQLEQVQVPSPATTPFDKHVHEVTKTFSDSQTPVDDDDDAQPVGAEGEAEREIYVQGIPLSKHGTITGYAAGCRMRDECPAKSTTGVSCANAASAYQKAYKERKAAEAASSSMASVDYRAEVGDGTSTTNDPAPSGSDAGAAVESRPALVKVPADDILTELADTKEELEHERRRRKEDAEASDRVVGDLQSQLLEITRERDGLAEELSATRKRVGDLVNELGQAAIALDVEKSRTRDDAIEQLRTVPMTERSVELAADRRPAELSILSLGEGMKLAFEGDGRLELDFAGGQLTHAAVSTVAS